MSFLQNLYDEALYGLSAQNLYFLDACPNRDIQQALGSGTNLGVSVPGRVEVILFDELTRRFPAYFL